MFDGFDGLNKGRHQLIIPDIDNLHYNMIDAMINNNSENFITKVLYYDSLTTPAAKFTKKKTASPQIKEFISSLVGVFNKFFLIPIN